MTPDNQPDDAEEDVLDEGDDSAIKNDTQDKKPVGDTEKATKKEKPEKVEKIPVQRGQFDDPEDTHFMLYISLVGAVIFLTYIAVHNKKRILGKFLSCDLFALSVKVTVFIEWKYWSARVFKSTRCFI